MTPTPHGQVPAIQRYKIGYHSDEWGMRSSTPGGVSDPSGQWVLYKDHIAALHRLHAENKALRTQQDDAYDHGPQAETVEEAARDVGKWLNERPNRPLDLRHVAMLTHHAKRTAHVQNSPENEHVADDVSKSERESNMTAQPDLGTLNGLAKQYADSYASPHHFTLGVNGLRQIIQRALPQAAPAAQADSVLEDAARYRWLRDEAHPDGVVNDDIHVHVDSLHYPNRWALIGPELDAAVDAARAAQKEKPHDI